MHKQIRKWKQSEMVKNPLKMEVKTGTIIVPIE